MMKSHVKSSLFFLVTSHCRHIWSRGSSHLRAVLCMMAVRKLCGLKKPASHTDGGTCGRRAVVQCVASNALQIIS